MIVDINDRCRLMHGDCIEMMGEIPSGSVDMILCDLPYQSTACHWDTMIPFKPLWGQYERIIKRNGAIVLTASQPFTSALVMSNPKLFKYALVWDKVNKYTGALNANRMPMKRHEDILVFYKAQPTYNKQYREGKPYSGKQTKGHGGYTQYGNPGTARILTNDGRHNPCSVIQIPADNKKELGLHPTQKPAALFEYLTLTFSNPDEVILDNTMGSGTAGYVAAKTGRRFIGIERDEGYFGIARERIETAFQKPDERQDLFDMAAD